MYLLINTASPICEITFFDDGKIIKSDKWEAGRNLARDLISYLEAMLLELNKTFSSIDGIGIFEGPGSFTGLRIGMTVMNTIADSENIQIVGTRGDDWSEQAILKLKNGENQKIVLPFYGSEANITVSRK